MMAFALPPKSMDEHTAGVLMFAKPVVTSIQATSDAVGTMP